MQETRWAPGREVGRYVLLRELARGGMAEIWLAQQAGPRGFNREVVIKRILTDDADQDGDFEQMFFDEARLAAQLTHPNIVQVYEFDEVEGTPYLVMEHLSGEALSRVCRELARSGRWFSPAQAAAVVERAAQALGYAHRKVGSNGEPLHIVHRDVSPQNVFVTYEGIVKVLDFGIARAVGRISKTDTGMVKGKASYMAPEQADGKPQPASDVFSLGVVLYELLTAQRLYGDADQMAVFRRLMTNPAPFPGPTDANPQVPKALDVITRKAMDRNPDERYADGEELAQALRAWGQTQQAHVGEQQLRELMEALFHERIQESAAWLVASRRGLILEAATPSGPFTQPGRTSPQLRAGRKRTRNVRGALALGTLLLVGTGVGAAVMWNSKEDPEPVSDPVASADLDAGVEPAQTPPGPAASVPDAGVEAPSPNTTPPRTTASRGRMKLSLDTTPWTRVFLGKTKLGETPLLGVSIPSGVTQLRLINESQSIDLTIEVEGRPGDHVVKKLSL